MDWIGSRGNTAIFLVFSCNNSHRLGETGSNSTASCAINSIQTEYFFLSINHLLIDSCIRQAMEARQRIFEGTAPAQIELVPENEEFGGDMFIRDTLM